MPNEISPRYPKEYETSVVLKDGSTGFFRPIRLDDIENWLEFYNNLNERAKFLRLQYIPREMTSEDALRFCTVDYTSSFAFVAEAMENQKRRIIAVGRYNRLPSDSSTAEIAFIIEDKYQEKGIGTKFIEWLAIVARKNQIKTFEAYVLDENTQMMSVLQGYGFHMKKETEKGVHHISFPLTKTPEVVKKKDERSVSATLKSLQYILKPRSVAVIGASNRAGAIGQLVFQSMIQNGFTGVVYPVSSSGKAVMSVKAYPSVLDIPDNVDLGIIAVPSKEVIKVTDECGRKKVKGVIIISDGFKESGPEGTAMERELRRTAFGYGMRIVGPNCMGLINASPQVKLNATFALIQTLPGKIAFITQSGALGLGILQYAKNLNIGFSSYISVGNRADIASTDMLQYWENDPETEVILLYLESFDNPEIFSRISRRVSASKPILAIKGGNTEAGSRATMSHTGAMTTSGTVSDALFYQAGIVRVDTIENLFHSAMLLANQPVPKGKRVAVLTNGGGPGVLAADACSQSELILPEISAETLTKLKTVIKRNIGISNPLDLTAGGSGVEFEETLKILAADPDYDAIIVIYIPPAGVNIKDVEDAINRAVPVLQQYKKPVLACFVGQTESKGKLMDSNFFVPYYLFPEDAVLALANAVKYSEIKNKQRGTITELKDIDQVRGQQLINKVLISSIERPLWLPISEMTELFKCYGIRMAQTMPAANAEEAADIAERLSFPVAVKLNSATISHKSDVGGIILDVNSREEVKKAFAEIKSRLKKIGREKEMQGVTLQHMFKEGVEVIIGTTQDASLGHMIMFGLGGIYAELIKDTVVRLQPLTDLDVREMINSLKMTKLLKGYRGTPPMDIKSLEDLLLRISLLVEHVPQITEMDLNPVKVLPDGQGYRVLDGRIMIK